MQAIHASINFASFIRVTNLLGEKKITQAEQVSAAYLNNFLVIFL